jgi:hypothetical protein
MTSTDFFGVKANVRAPHRFLRFGALVWLTLPNPGSGHERICVAGLSRGGRRVATYVDARDLHNYRPGWIANSPPFPDSPVLFPFDTREKAQAFCDYMNATFAAGDVRPHAAEHGHSQSPAKL